MPIVSTYAGYPIYSLAIASPPSSNESKSKSDSKDSKDKVKESSHEEGCEIVLSGGGGGPGRSGVKNKITIFSASPSWDSLTIHTDYEFSKNEDSAMSVAIHPKEKVVFASVNPAQANTKQSKGDKEKEKDSKNNATGNCRLFKWDDTAKSLSSLSSNVSTVEKNSMEEYQRVSAFSPDGKYLACGTTAGKVSILSFPDLTPTSYSPITFSSEIFDLDWDSTSSNVVVTSGDKIIGYNVKDGKESFQVERRERKGVKGEFRGGRFATVNNELCFFTVENFGAKMACLTRWVQSDGKWIPNQSRPVASKRIVSFTVSPIGNFVAAGLADCSLLLVKSSNLASLKTYKAVHGMPITSMVVDKTGTKVLTAAVDGFIKTIDISGVGAESIVKPILILILLFISVFTATSIIIRSPALLLLPLPPIPPAIANIPFLNAIVKPIHSALSRNRNQGLDHGVGESCPFGFDKDKKVETQAEEEQCPFGFGGKKKWVNMEDKVEKEKEGDHVMEEEVNEEL